jgi:hypothetical protein
MPIAQLDDLAWIFGLFTLHLIVPCPACSCCAFCGTGAAQLRLV